MTGAAADLVVADARYVLTMDPARRILERASVAIRDGAIAAVGPAAEVAARWVGPETEVLDGTDRLVTPGLVNAHTHLESCFDKGLMAGMPVGPFVARYFDFTYGTLDEEGYELACLANLIGCLKTGTTTVADCGTLPGWEGVAAGAVDAVGVRAVLARCLMDAAGDGPFAETTAQALDRAERFLAAHGGDPPGPAAPPRVTAALDLQSLDCCTDALIRDAAALAADRGAGLHGHVAYSHDTVELARSRFGARDVERLAALGALSPRFVAAHAVCTTAHELLLLRDRGAHVAHVPGASLFFAQGAVAPGNRFRDYASAGINLALGNDEASTGTAHDLVRDIYLATVAHAEAQQPRTVPDRDLFMLAPGDDSPPALEMATVGGAAALGLGDRIGSLEPGRRADLVLWDLTAWEWTPTVRETVVANFVCNGTGRSADTVLCDGRPVLRGGRVVGVDEDDVRARVQERAERTVAGASWLARRERWTLTWSSAADGPERETRGREQA